MFQIVKWYEKDSYKLQDVNGKVYKTRVNGWRLKSYFVRFEAGDSNNSSSNNGSSDNEDEGAPIPSKQEWE